MVDAVLALAVMPQDEVSVGTAAFATVFGRNIARLLTEAARGRQTHLAAQKSESAPGTEGGLYSLVPESTEISGGWLK